MIGSALLAAEINSFPHDWSAQILTAPPLIAPARSYIYPQQIAGEEDSLNRGALHTFVRPASGGAFLATFALGFTDRTMPTGLFSCPSPQLLCAVAGGYAYLVDTTDPDPSANSRHKKSATLLQMKPVTAIHAVPQHNLLLFSGFHSVLAVGSSDIIWQSQRLSWEGVRLASIDADTLHGTGWNLLTDREVPFTLNLLTGDHKGGGFTPPATPTPSQRS